MNLILFGFYIFTLVILFGFIAILVMHIGVFREYSRYLSVVLKIYLITIILIGIFGGYKILTDYTPAKKNRNTQVQKIDF